MHPVTKTAVLAASTTLVVAISYCYAHPVVEQTNTIAIRAPEGTAVGEWFDEKRRIKTALFTNTQTSLATFTAGACAALYGAPNPGTGAACGILAFSWLIYTIAGHWQGLQDKVKRDGEYLLPAPMVQLHPSEEDFGGPSTMAKVQSTFDGTNPVLMAYHDCTSPGCYQVHYRNYEGPEASTVHHLKLTPRGGWDSKTDKRQDREDIGDGSRTEDDGTPLFADYHFYDVRPSIEREYGNDQADLQKDIYLAGIDNPDFGNQGYMCVNILDSDKSNAAATRGYSVLSQDYHMADPQMESTYLSNCYGGGNV